MKQSSRLLCLSLIVNAGLLITLFTAAPQAHDTTRTQTNESSRTFSTHTETSSVSSTSTPTAASTRRAVHNSLWEQLFTEDLAVLIARLKSAGFTYKEIRTIISEVGGKKFEIAEEELFSQRPKTPYWKRQNYDEATEKEFVAKYQTLMQERSAFYTKYFNGPDSLAENEDAADYARQQYGPLSIEKLQAVTRIENDYNDLATKISTERLSRANTQVTLEDRQKRRLLEAEHERDVQQVLSPDEFAEYQLRESFTAQRLREQFQLLRLSETEYKTLYALQRPIDQEFDLWSPDKEGQTAYAEAQKKLAPQIEAALGPDRYADYKQLIDSPNDQVVVLMSRLELPLATAGKITALRDSANTEAKVIRNDSTLSASDRDALLAKLSRETETKLGTLLRTPRGLEAYTELKGDWLRALHPKP